MASGVVGWRGACAAWGELARPGLPGGETGKGRSDSLRHRQIPTAQGCADLYAVVIADWQIIGRLREPA
jgi:hypothetical protein